MRKKNNKKKLFILFIVLSMFFIVGSAGPLALVMIFPKEEFVSYCIYATLGGIGLGLILLVIALIIRKKDNVEKEMLASDLSISLDAYKKGEKKLIIPSSSSNGLNNLAASINSLGYSTLHLVNGSTYSKEDFVSLFPVDFRNRRFKAAFLVRFFNVSKRNVKKLQDALGEFVVVEDSEKLYALVFDVALSSLEVALIRLIKEERGASAAYVAYPFKEISLAIEELDSVETEPGKLYKLSSEEVKDSFDEFIVKASNVDLDKEESLTEYLKEALPHLDLTHIGIKLNGSYLRQVTYTDLPMLNEVREEDFMYKEEFKLIDKPGTKAILILASVEKYRKLDKDQVNKLLVFISTIRSIVNVYLDLLVKQAKDTKLAEMEKLTGVYGYTISLKHELKGLCADLENKVGKDVIGKKCYKVLFGLDKPCKECPLNTNNVRKIMPILGSEKYLFKISTNQENKEIFLLPQTTKSLMNVDKLHEKLLDLVNADERGYVLAIHIENIDDLASRNKTDIGNIIAGIYSRLTSYNLGYNLYMKSKDEFVYILENISRVEAIEVGKKVTFALNDKLDIGKKGMVIPYRIILLSYPLEVSSIFHLDSLCRTMFELADKRGRLYMVDEEPLPIDKHRYYVETLEDAFKKDDIPLSYVNTFDRKDKSTYQEIHLNFLDYEDRPIKEDELTLYAKQDGLYLTLIERLVRQLSFGEESKYILPLAKEGLNKVTFETINKILNNKKIDKSRLVLLIRERDYDRFMNEVKIGSELGLQFAISNLLNYSKYQFEFKPILVRVNLSKYNNDSEYASRVISIVNKGIDISSEEVIEGIDNRFIESK